MNDLIVGIGLVFVIEGLLWALFPQFALRMLVAASEIPEKQLRTGGAIAVGFGVLVVWFIRG